MRYLFIIFAFILFVGAIADGKKDEYIVAFEESNYSKAIELANQCLTENPKNYNAWYYKGLSEKALFKYTDAVTSFEQALVLSSESSSLLYLLGSCYESAGNSPKAIISYKKLLQSDSTHIPASNSLAKVYINNKDYPKAIELYSNLVKIDSTNGYFYAQLAYCCKKFGFTEPVINYYEKAIKLKPTDLESCSDLVSEYINQKYYDDANRLIDTFLVHFPNNLHLLKQRAYIFAIGGNYLDAVKAFQIIVELGDSTMFTSKYYGQSLYNNGQYGDAVFWLNRYATANPDDARNQFILGLAYQKDYQYEKSLQYLHLAMGLLYDKELIARVFTETGNTYASYGDYLGYRDSTKLKAPEMYNLAKQNYAEAFELVPADFEMYRTFGRFYEEKMKDKRMALYYYKKYYEEHDSHKIYEHDLIWVQSKITKLSEELHFMGE